MSVVPLRPPDGAGAPRKPRVPPGTVNIRYGYRLAEQGRRGPKVKSSQRRQPRPPAADGSSRAQLAPRQDQRESPSDKNGADNKMNESSSGSAKNENGARPKDPEYPADNKSEESMRRGRDSTNEERSAPRVKFSEKVEKSVAILPSDPNAAKKDLSEREKRDLDNFLRTNDFIEHTNKRILKNKIHSLVDEGIAEYEKGIEARREKLRSTLLGEEETLTREVIDQAQRGADLRFEETRRRTEELRKRVEEQRLATVAEKRARQYAERCPETRSRFTRKTTLETKYSNLVQMAENEAKREAERELEAFWHELTLKEVEAKKAREVAEEGRRAEAGRSIGETLEKQIAGKLALFEEEKRVKEEERENLEKLLENVRREESSNPARRREERERLRRDLEEQLSTARGFVARRAREEEAAERALRALAEAEPSRERAVAEESSLRARAEIEAYMASLEEFRHEKARREAEIEAVVNAAARQADEGRDLARRQARDDRARRLREVLGAREQQLRRKSAEAAKAAERAALEAELQRRETDAKARRAAEAERERRESARRYGEELKAQRKFTEDARRREREAIERMHRDDLQREKEYEKLAERALNAPEIVTPHAFGVLLRECAARRVAKQKDLCSSSPSTRRPGSTAPPGHP